MGDFCAQHPGIEVALFVGNRQAVLERLAHNQDDLYVLGHPPEKLLTPAADAFHDFLTSQRFT